MNPTSLRHPAYAVLLLIVLAFGVGLRFYDLGGKVYWHDEAHTSLRVFGHLLADFQREAFDGEVMTVDELLKWQHAQPGRTVGDTLEVLALRPEHGPLYYLLARLWAVHFDDPVVGTRSLSALVSLLLFPAMFWLARELFEPRAAAWVTVALVAVSPFQLLYAQEARQYALWAVFTALSCAAFLRALRRESAGAWLIYALALVAALYTHLMTSVVIVAHGVYLLWQRRERTRGQVLHYFAAVGLAVLLLSPWLWLLAGKAVEVQQVTAWMQREALLSQLLYGWALHVNRLFFDGERAVWLIPLALLLAAVAVAAVVRETPPRTRRFLILVLVASAAVLMVPDLVRGGRRSLESRYLIPSYLALQLCVAWWFTARMSAPAAFERRIAHAFAVLVAVGGMLSCAAIAASDTWWNKSMSAYNAEVARIVNAAERPLLLTSDGDIGPGEILSLSHRLDPKVRVMLFQDLPQPRIPPGYSDIFLLTPSGFLREALERDYVLETETEIGRLWRLVPRTSAESP